MDVTCAAAIRDTQAPGWQSGCNGWDTHAHVFGPLGAFPYHPARRYAPPEQTAEDYLATLDALGIGMGVLVQPSVYGNDNAALLHSLSLTNRLLGVVEADVLSLADEDVCRWTRQGVCGVRIWWDGKRDRRWLVDVALRLEGTGWHLDVYCPAADGILDIAAIIDTLPLPVMIEAMGTPRAGQPLDTPAFAMLLGLLRDGRVWVKLSHPYKIDTAGPPYVGAVPFARAIVEAAPDRAVWGSDWPHPMIAGAMPNDGHLLDLLLDWTSGDPETARRILEDNPAAFYGGSLKHRHLENL